MQDPYGTYARFYDLDLAGRDDDLLMIQQFADLCGSPVLELACGTGRVLMPLAQHGHQVTGVDVSQAMLDLARRKLAGAGLAQRVILAQQDMRQLALEGRFSFAFIAANSFMHLLTTGDQLAALVGIRHHLNPAGLLLLDLFNPDLSRLLDFRGRVTLEKVMVDPDTGHQLIKFSSEEVDLGQQTIHVTYIIDEVDGQGHLQRTLFPFSVRYLFRYELELLLRQAGFTVEAIYGSYSLDEFTGESERLIAVARRSD